MSSKMTRDSQGDWKYRNSDSLGYSLEVEWARNRKKEIVLAIGGNRCWVSEEDLDDVFEAMRDALNKPCLHCGGSGKENVK